MRSTAAVVAAVAVAVMLGACGEDGDGETERDRIAAVVEQMHEDLSAGKVAEVCAAMARRPRVQLGSVGHNRRPTTCVADLREFVKGTEQAVGLGGEPNPLHTTERPRILDVAIQRGGRVAMVTMSLGADPYAVPFVKEGEQWKVDDFFGATGPTPKGLQ